MRITVKAPNRIPLAGESLAVYPAYLIAGGGITINAAINLCCQVQLEPQDGTQVIIRSEDLGKQIHAPSWQTMPNEAALNFIARVVQFNRPQGGVKVVTRNEAPWRSGFGSSSALIMALCAGFGLLNGHPRGIKELTRVAADLETQILQVACGRQDHYAAGLGGINAFWFDVAEDRIEPLDPSGKLATALSQRLVIAAVDSPGLLQNNHHPSELLTANRPAKPIIDQVKEATYGMRDALLEGPNWEKLAYWWRREWNAHRSIYPQINCPIINGVIEAAHKAGASAVKFYPSGSGGCLIALTPPADKTKVEAAVRDKGGHPLSTTISTMGLSVQISAEQMSGDPLHEAPS